MDSELENKRKRLAALLSKDREENKQKQSSVEGLQKDDRLPEIDWDNTDSHEPFPLTGVQQSYLIGRSGDFVLGNISTHNYFEIDLDDLDVSRFNAAWNKLIQRHEMLRAVFSEEGSQRVLDDVGEYQIPFDDLAGLNEKEAETKLQEIRERLSHQIFAVDTFPLFELYIVRKHDGGVRLHFSMDLLVADAMSTMILIRELDLLYDEPQLQLPPLEISFKGFVEATRIIEKSDAYSDGKAYWQQRVDSIPPGPELPLARTPESIENPRFKRRQFVLEADKWQFLQEKIKAAGISPSIFLVTLFSQVLARWSKVSHFTLNLTLLNRLPLHEQINALVGDFTSLTLLEIEVDQSTALLDNARGVQKQLWKDMTHRYFDGIDVLRLLNRHYGGQQSVYMPVVFTSALGLAGSGKQEQVGELFSNLTRLSADGSYGITQSSQVWLDHVVRESEGALGCTWDALEALFPEGVLDDMFAVYSGLLEDYATGELELSAVTNIALPPAQLQKRKVSNSTESPISKKLMHELFYEEALRNGDRPAIKSTEAELDYKTLNQVSAALADNIQKVDDGQSELIAIVMVKGWRQIAAAMGILYYGRAYLPIDGNLPIDRIHLLLKQSGANIVIIDDSVEDTLSLSNSYKVLDVKLNELLQQKNPKGFHCNRKPGDIAYTIFTSGSTGIPKGVVIDHQGAVNTLLDINQRFGINADDKVLAVSSLSFDLSVYDIFGVLAAGGTVVLPEAEKDKDPAHWLELVKSEGVTLWNSVPPLAQLLLEQVDEKSQGALSTIRLMLLSGDWIAPDLPVRIREHHPSMKIISLGGATEASIWSIFHPIEGDTSALNSIPYGKPLLNQSFYVLDDNLQDRPDWAAGQLFIGGIGLAKEYWGDKEKTKNSFINHEQYGRLYKTGDLGRFMDDGNIEFLGRNDAQVKIRGNRVELGEIESALLKAEGLKDAVVVAAGNKFGQKHLVAYIVSDVAEDSLAIDKDSHEVLIDPVERASFKLSELGLRQFSQNDLPVWGLPKVEGTLQLASSKQLLEASKKHSEVTNVITLHELGAWLSCLTQYEVDGHIIAKRQYPSAGSTYPVQCYLSVHEHAITDLPEGHYYYDPKVHQLVKLDAPKEGSAQLGCPESGFGLYLIADQRAIAPLYGKFADKFSVLEAGHMQQLLLATAAAQGLVLVPEALIEADTLNASLGLSTSHKLITCLFGYGGADKINTPALTLNTFNRQSYRTFHGESFDCSHLQQLLKDMPSISSDIYVCIHPAKSTNGVNGEMLRYDTKTGDLIAVGEVDEALLRKSQGIENQSVNQDADFTLYLIGSDLQGAKLLEAGRWAQEFMHRSSITLFGGCPVGNVSLDLLKPAMQLEDMDLLYCMIGGSITKEQTSEWPAPASAGKQDGFGDLRAYLGTSLPDYMIPSIFVPMEKIPLTSNGKLNRAALPEVESSELQSMREYVAPGNSVELDIAKMWCQVLEVDKVGVHDNFFEIGGNSLSAIRLLSLIRKAYATGSTEMPLRFLFEHPTIAEISESILLNNEALMLKEVQSKLLDNEEVLVEGEL